MSPSGRGIAGPTSMPPRVGCPPESDRRCMQEAASSVPRTPIMGLWLSEPSSDRQTDTMIVSEKWRYSILDEHARTTESLMSVETGEPHEPKKSLNLLRHQIKNPTVSCSVFLTRWISSGDCGRSRNSLSREL